MLPLMWPDDNGDVENYRGYQIKQNDGLYKVTYNRTVYSFDNLPDCRTFIDAACDGPMAARREVVDEYVEQ